MLKLIRGENIPPGERGSLTGLCANRLCPNPAAAPHLISGRLYCSFCAQRINHSLISTEGIAAFKLDKAA